MAGTTKFLIENLYSRKIIGWAFGKIMDAELNVKYTEWIIIQSDLGSQYTSNLFESALAELKSAILTVEKAARTIIFASNHYTLFWKRKRETSGNIKMQKPLTTWFLNTLNLGITASAFIQVWEPVWSLLCS